jgi:3-dehydroquinate synthase
MSRGSQRGGPGPRTRPPTPNPQPPAPVTTVHVPLTEPRDASYDVLAGRGILQELPGLLAQRCPAHLYAVVTDSRVAELYGKQVLALLEGAGLSARLFTFPAGEWNKSRETWGDLSDQMLAAHVARDCAIVALGGGVVGDLAGFVAATFHRGIPYAHVPTTALAMIDASIGGKTGVDVPAGKNLIGAFHQPRFVLADIDTLATLPRNQLAAGLAEAIKHGVIADAAYAEAVAAAATPCLKRSLDALEPVVTRSIGIKVEVVSADTHEAGRRQILNYGHTVGHAVEARSGYGLLHGEAVAIGMAVEAWLAEETGVARVGTRQAVLALLEAYGLPSAVPSTLASHDLLETMQLDKKVRAGAVRFALPCAIGRMAQSADGAWTVEIPAQQILRALDANR